MVDQQLGKNKYMAGDNVTLADINLLALFDPCEMAKIDLSKYKNITKWRNALKAAEFYTKCYKEYGEALRATAKT